MLKEHNLDLAIRSLENLLSNSNLDPTLPTFPTQDLIPTSLTFNISADTIAEPTKPVVVVPLKATVASTDTILEEEKATLDQLLNCAYEKDPILNRVLELLAQGANYSKDLTIADCSVVNGRLYYQGLLYVLNYHALYLRLCKLHHDTPIADHFGIGNTYELLHCSYYWPNMQGFVRRYVRHCHMCKRSKCFCFKKQGLLPPLPVPEQRW